MHIILAFCLQNGQTKHNPLSSTPVWHRPVLKYHSLKTVLVYFLFFFDDDLVGLIVDETNRYAQQTLQGTNKVWETDASEIGHTWVL